MKSVLIICAGSLATFAAAGNRPDPVDSLNISRDLSLDQVVAVSYTHLGINIFHKSL